MNEKPKLTTAAGAPVPDNTSTLTAGERGVALMQDVWMHEKMGHFNREVIPERRMHAKGWGAYGRLVITSDISRFTKARVLRSGAVTEAFVRFSTVAGERGAADTVRDIRGFACRFYSDEGNWDLVGNNTPTFFLRDGQKFADLNRAIKRDPQTGRHSAQNNWDFWTLVPESFHQVTITMSDRGIPASFRNMDGFGSHTFSLINAQNRRIWCKFHFRTQQGIKCLTDEDAKRIAAADPDFNGRDLFEAIKGGNYPRWTFCIQVMTEEQAKKHYDNPFDITKTWSEKEFPLIKVGYLELNKNPQNFFAEVEQVGFNPGNAVPGIGFSPDKLLQTRLFAYGDAQRYRLGVNNNLIPVNKPRVPLYEYHRDGQMRVDGNYGPLISYTPNSYGLWQAQPEFAEPKFEVCGEAGRYDPNLVSGVDNFRQGGELFRSMREDEKSRLIANTARSINGAAENVKMRHCVHCLLADEEYGKRMIKALGQEYGKIKQLADNYK